MSNTINRQDAIEALKICDNNTDGINCYKCPLRDERWDGAWEDDETNCYTKLMRDSAKLLELPSAESEPIRINLNEQIKVKLTDWGKEIYYHQYDRINQIAGREICKPRLPKEDENGYTEFQLWCFIELYGMHIGMTKPNVIEPLEIVYERRTE